LPARPLAGLPEIPANLPDIHDKRLMEIFALYVGWNNYIDVQRVTAEIEEANAETAFKLLEATGIVAGWDNPKIPVTVTKAEAQSDPEYVEAKTRFDQAKARRKMLAVLSNNMERGAALLSRELSRRIGRAPVEGRMAGWTT